MFEKFTRASRDTVTRAVELAGRSGARQVRPEHVLAALAADPSSAAMLVLVDLGVPAAELTRVLDGLRSRYVDGLDAEDADALRVLGIDLDDVMRRIERDLGGSRRRRRGHLPFSREAKKSLELALREALHLDDRHIGTEHLLLGLVRSGDRTVLDALAGLGVSPADLRAAVAGSERRTG